MTAHRKELIKLLREASRRHNLWDVFADFVTMAALSVANAVDLAQRDEREAEYMRIVGRYDRDELALFPRMLAVTVEALEAEPRDFLGEVFGELELGNAARGQFFTPSELCRLMAAQTVGTREELQALVDQRGYIRVHEPACGASPAVEKPEHPAPDVPTCTTDAPAAAAPAAPQLTLF